MFSGCPVYSYVSNSIPKNFLGDFVWMDSPNLQLTRTPKMAC